MIPLRRQAFVIYSPKTDETHLVISGMRAPSMPLLMTREDAVRLATQLLESTIRDRKYRFECDASGRVCSLEIEKVEFTPWKGGNDEA